ncbi:MAG TPA: methyltransferase domain-containing protein, partial [Patescibacteria group bacterium]|nr:methyltransferase domain-containing protein [Patescibacteria group bacterium]
FRNNYGSFGTCRNEKKKRIINVGNVSSIFLGDIIEIIRGLKERPKRILLAGDNNGCKKPFKKALNLDSSEIVTAGLLKPNDFLWNFEHDTPKMGKFDLILSQAMLEHLVNPYKHVEELSKLLVKGGHLVVHTVMPGYDYHPCPVDTLRYYPDWFEEVAIRLKLKIEKKDIRNSHIFYVFEK